MTRILYGLCGVGIGHAVRGKVIIEHLKKKHDVLIICSSKPYDYLKKEFKNVHKIEGFELIFKNNSIADYLTFLKNLKKIYRLNLENVEKAIEDFKPELVISDWETFSSIYAKRNDLPLISVDNQHFLISGEFDFPKRYFWDYLKAKFTINLLMKRADYYIITSFYQTRLRNRHENIFLVPPILRDEIFNIKPAKKNYILVYQSTNSYDKLIKILKDVDERFIVYGFDKSSKEKNLEFKRFDEKDFLKDLKDCEAVICNGGFTFISEAIYLRKPILSLPINGHFEQLLNAMYIKKMGYGEFYRNLDVEKIKLFIKNLNKYKNVKHRQDKNKVALKRIDLIIKDIR